MHTIKRNTLNKTKKTVGRGGTRGKTSGRGHKGQKQHGGHGIRPEIRDMIKKLPKLRGRGKNINKPVTPRSIVVNLNVLNEAYKPGETVSHTTLVEKGLLKGNQIAGKNIKILGNGDLKKKLTVSGCLISKTAEEKITKAGGTIKK